MKRAGFMPVLYTNMKGKRFGYFVYVAAKRSSSWEEFVQLQSATHDPCAMRLRLLVLAVLLSGIKDISIPTV